MSVKPPQGRVRKPRRYRPGTVALRQIRKYQTSTDLLIPKLSFQRFVKEIIQTECCERQIESKNVQGTALLALQCAAEHYVTELFSQSQIAAFHGKRLTVIPDDLQLVLKFRGDELKFKMSDQYNDSILKETTMELSGEIDLSPNLTRVTPNPLFNNNKGDTSS